MAFPATNYTNEVTALAALENKVTNLGWTPAGLTNIGFVTGFLANFLDNPTVLNLEAISSTSAHALAVGATAANPAFNVDCSTASQVAGVTVKGAATGGTVAIATTDTGSANNLTIDALGTGTISIGSVSTGQVTLGSLTATTVKSASASALAVGLNGATNPAFDVDASTASQAAGLKVKGAATGGTVAISTIDSGAANNLTIDALTSGTITIGGTSTGIVSIGRGKLGSALFSSTIAGLGTTQNSTPTAAQLLGGIVTQTGATGAGTVTTPTGTVLSAAIPGVATGDIFETIYANLGGGFNEVITAGASGMTVVGNATVPSGKNALLQFACTGSNTWNCYVIVSA